MNCLAFDTNPYASLFSEFAQEINEMDLIDVATIDEFLEEQPEFLETGNTLTSFFNDEWDSILTMPVYNGDQRMTPDHTYFKSDDGSVLAVGEKVTVISNAQSYQEQFYDQYKLEESSCMLSPRSTVASSLSGDINVEDYQNVFTGIGVTSDIPTTILDQVNDS